MTLDNILALMEQIARNNRIITIRVFFFFVVKNLSLEVALNSVAVSVLQCSLLGFVWQEKKWKDIGVGRLVLRGNN